MTLKDEFERNVDKAWVNLHTRFKEDGLLAPAISGKKQRTKKYTLYAGIAAVAVGCIFTVFVILEKNNSALTEDMLTLHNERGKPTMVATLEDGSVAFLSDRTSLEYPAQFASDKREVYLEGDAFFEVSKNHERPFFIDTKPAVIEVIGTSFNVIARDETSFSLSVRSGEVKVTSKTNKESVHVKAGETVIIYSDKLYTTLTSDVEQFRKYLARIGFKDHPLADVIRIINENSDSVQIKLSPELADKHLTVTLLGESPDKMVEYICMALNLNFIRKQNIIYITSSQ